MGLTYSSLDSSLRELMYSEFEKDIHDNSLYLSKRFNDTGISNYPDIMRRALNHGSDDSLAADLIKYNCFNKQEERINAEGVKIVKVPVTAPQTFSEGEFNRFYIRAICIKAINENMKIEVYRARHSDNPRPGSESLIGLKLDPATLLADLRANKGLDTALGLPNGPNSGLSLKLVQYAAS